MLLDPIIQGLWGIPYLDYNRLDLQPKRKNDAPCSLNYPDTGGETVGSLGAVKIG